MGAGKNKAGSPVAPCPYASSGKTPASNQVQKYKNISVQCKHRTCPPASYIKIFELVPETSLPINDEITVSWSGNDPAPPKSLTVLESGKSTEISGPPYKIPLENESILSLFPESYKKTSKSKSVEFGVELLKTIFTFNKTRSLSISGLPDGPLKVTVYNPDQWSLKVTFPIPGTKSRKSGTKWEGSMSEGYSTTMESSSSTYGKSDSKSVQTFASDSGQSPRKIEETKTKSDHQETTVKSEFYLLPDGTKVYPQQEGNNVPQTKVSPDSIITLKKNGAPLTINGLGILHFIFQLMKWVQNISKILDDIPKCGAYAEWSYKILEGGFFLQWGWQEYKPDHRAFMGLKGEFDIKVLDVTLEAGIGASGFSVKFQVFAQVNGALDIKASVEKTQPWTDANSGGGKNVTSDPSKGPLNASLNASIIGSVGARFEAFYFVKIEPKISTGLTLEGNLTAFNQYDPFIVDATLKFNGIKGTVTTSVGFADVNGEARSWDPESNADQLTGGANVGLRTGGEGTSDDKKEVVFMGEYQLGHWKWPDAFNRPDRKNEPTEDLTDEDLKRSIKEMLQGRYLNSGFWNGKKIVIKKQMTKEEQDEEWEIVKYVKYKLLGHDTVKEADEDKIVDRMLHKIAKQTYFDKTPKQVQLFLAKTHEQLVPLMKERQGHHLEVNYIDWHDFKTYLNGKHFYELIQNNIDYAKEFKVTNGC
jgi:hypothetical protein